MRDECSPLCWRYWNKHQFNQFLICPGCETWTDKDGNKWRKLNLPDDYPEIHVTWNGEIVETEVKTCEHG